VFLVESVVNHAFELQAIARVDRMGQKHPTEVFCYYAEDTIERNILDLAVRRGLSLYTKENAVGTLTVSQFGDTENPSSPSKRKEKKQQKGDFIFRSVGRHTCGRRLIKCTLASTTCSQFFSLGWWKT
jgi:E3 ubiquitin-protein ligase SHPRH